MKRLILLLLAFGASGLFGAPSIFPERLEDPSAVYVEPAAGDATGRLQAAIDEVADTTRQGIVFLASGRYEVTRTLYVWPGVRIIGTGAERPLLVLPERTPGYDHAPAYLILFTGGGRGGGRMRQGGGAGQPFAGTVPPKAGVEDANPGTFYSAMSNVDVEIGPGNAGAVAIRFHVAQHCFLSHMTFRTGSGYAALEDIGNEGEDLRFEGGQFGIVTGRPSPGWQYSLLDSTFSGQKVAGIQEHEAGLALIHDRFENEPAAIDILDRHIEELWMENCRLAHISGPAVTISEEDARLTEINFFNLVCEDVPVFAKFRTSGTAFGGRGPYRVARFTRGLSLDADPGGRMVTETEVQPLAAGEAGEGIPAIAAFPEARGWANARMLGAKGDGRTDDTAALQRAIDTHRTVYLPTGRYRLTDTLRLRPDSVLVGLHPSTTQLDLNDQTPGFYGAGGPKALLLAPSGGPTQVRGIGLWTGGINNRAAAVIWKAGKDSLMDDVRLLGGHGTNRPDGTRIDPYDSSHGGDPNPQYRWDAQYPSLWITGGGGGTFADIWTPDTFAQAGLYISETRTEGHVYQLSSEHHVRNEVRVERAANWELIALQTEEERGESGQCLPLSITDSEKITVAEMHAYRVVSSSAPFGEAVVVAGSREVHFRNMHEYSDSKAVFDSAVRAEDSGVDYREGEFATLDLPAVMQAKRRDSPRIERIARGFFNVSSPAVDRQGRVYFADPVKQRIYRLEVDTGRVALVCDHPIDAGNLFLDPAGDLIVVSYQGDGTVYAMSPKEAGVKMRLLKPVKAAARPDMTPVLAADHWRFDRERQFDIGSEAAPWQYVSPDGKLFLPAGDDFVQGERYYGTKMADVLRAFALREAPAGKRIFVTDEGQEKTYTGIVAQDGSLKAVKLFAQRGGEAALEGPDGKVYLAAGQLYVYSQEGKQLAELEVPDRPTGLVWAGKDRRALVVLARTSLYVIR